MDPSAPCPVELATSLEALRAETQALTPILATMRSGELSRATRLPGWDVQVLAAHLVRGVDRIRAYLTETLPDEAELTWTSYFTTAMTSTTPRDVSERARAFAASINDRAVVDVWQVTVDEALRLAAIAHPARYLQSPFGSLRLDHYLPSRVLEVTVHGLDLRAALGLEEVATPPGLAVTVALLEALLDGSRPPGLEDDLAFTLAATGRVDADDPRLPLLS